MTKIIIALYEDAMAIYVGGKLYLTSDEMDIFKFHDETKHLQPYELEYGYVDYQWFELRGWDFPTEVIHVEWQK